LLVNDDRRAWGGKQLVGGDGIGGRRQLRRTVTTHVQGGEVTAGWMRGVPGSLVVPSGRKEVAGLTAGGRHRVGLALADRVDVHAVKARRQDAARCRLDRDRREAAGEIELRSRDRLAVGRRQVCGQLLALALRGGGRRTGGR